MSDTLKNTNHSLSLNNRELLTLTGIVDVEAFNEEQINAVCDFGLLYVKGSGLHIEELNLNDGTMQVKGNISALIYNEKTQVKGFFKRAFS
jgi:sporulation protein YabP